MDRPGFWRGIAILPSDGCCTVEVEDDMHHMRVTLDHSEHSITAIEGKIIRAPWSTCPGAQAVLERTFVDAPLEAAAQLGGKKQNCTHLFDMAVVAAAHAGEDEALRYDLKVSDPVDGVRVLECLRDGKVVFQWVEKDRYFEEPDEIKGQTLLTLGDWIASLDRDQQEMARLLRGAGIISHGRQIPMDRQSDAEAIPANCFTFQPRQAKRARRIAGFHDFTEAMDRPLDGKPRETAL